MKKFTYIILILIIFTNCNNNTLKIFNGSNLNGWLNYGGGKFYVENNCIVAEAITGLPNTFLHTEKKYQNFELQFDVKLDTVLNSGVQIRSNIYQNDTETVRWGGRFDQEGQKDLKNIIRKAGTFWGYQIEIDPTSRAWSGAVYEEAGRGFLHTPGINQKVKSAFKPLEWNHYKIRVKDNHIQSWVNGVIIGDVYDDMTDDGYIALQLHSIGKNKIRANKKIRWKNLSLKEL
ncbi:MAG: DUF1080 domain-containing protein [Bacteroidota bacterium]|nr:DUF1080 domain-containing protein [Bacteroidota bacterium]MEC7619754.1 DUF1080 domain-containing protein [Bacteroidota bacterium]MEC8403038.1 DUF1080 domain-containing protein [Bacteroidota bacterium]